MRLKDTTWQAHDTSTMASNGSKRRKLDHAAFNDEPPLTVSSSRARNAFLKNASNWDLETQYETRRRKGKGAAQRENTRLPQLVTEHGRLQVHKGSEAEDEIASVLSDEGWLEGELDDADSVHDSADEGEDAMPEGQQIIIAQEELAKLALAINEKPDENIGALKSLAAIGQSKIPSIQVLALVTQMSVYKDIIPGYRIRPQSDDGPPEKLSKDIRRLRQYEHSLLAGYQAYIRELARCAKLETRPLQNGVRLSSVAIGCACTLTTAVPHFNFRSDLMKILVGKLSKRKLDADSLKCLKALQSLLEEDDEGRPSLEAVSLLTRMMKARAFDVNESLLDLFLHLRLLTEFSGKASQDKVDRASGQAPAGKAKKQFRTKRERKALKEQKSLEKDMAQADALVSHEERERMQSETLKLVFATYFRILKLRSPHLMGAVLEGLAKFAHLINQDFFGDLLEALKDLVRYAEDDAEATEYDEPIHDSPSSASRNLAREALLCTATAFALLAGQDAHKSRHELHLDLSFFTAHLFRSLLPLSLDAHLEDSKPKSTASLQTLPSASKINVQTTTVLLLRSLSAVLLPPYNIRQVPPVRLAAFTKQLMTSALQLPEKSAQAMLALLGDVIHTHAHRVGSLWKTEERKANGRFDALSQSAEVSNPFSSNIWEGELLRRHFSPKVREAIQGLEKSVSK